MSLRTSRNIWPFSSFRDRNWPETALTISATIDSSVVPMKPASSSGTPWLEEAEVVAQLVDGQADRDVDVLGRQSVDGERVHDAERDGHILSRGSALSKL